MSERDKASSATTVPQSSPPGVRSVGCVCEAASGSACRPDGDHLDRYVRAAKQGTIDRETLKQAVAGLTVVAPQTIVPSSTRTADKDGLKSAERVVRGHLQLVGADRDIE